MVARSNMYGCYGSYSYRLWSLANVWSNYHFSLPKLEGAATAAADYIRCSQCHKTFPGFAALKQHTESAHDAGGSPPPPGAASPAAAAAVLEPAPTPGGAFVCQHCSAAFSQRDHLEKHELLHSPNAQVSCKVCNKTFANVYRLQRHMISHDESAVLRKFKCPECDKAFKFKHHLKEHIRIHSGEKPFECANCGKRFSHSGSYSSHMTSKKCLVMNLKVGRGRGALDKSPQSSRASPGSVSSPNSKRLQAPAAASSPPTLGGAAFPSLLSGCGTTPSPSPAMVDAYATLLMYRNRCAAPFPGVLDQFLHHFGQHAPAPSGVSVKELEPPPRTESLLQQLRPPALPSCTNDVAEEAPEVPAEPENDSSSLKIVEIKEEPSEQEQEQEQEIKHEEPSVRAPSCDSANENHSDPVQSLLQSVGSSVTKERLEASMQKLAPPSPSPPAPQLACKHCGRRCMSAVELHQHESYSCELLRREESCEEGLAAKLASVKHESGASDDCDSARDQLTDDEAGSGASSGRKVRVRSLIADEQLSVLKAHYANNPKPKKEELARIADQIQFPVRVVQVWFQNTRARDRREGRFLVHAPYYTDYRINGNLATSYMPPNHVTCLPSDANLPLDLSTKKSSSSQCSSPRASTHSDSEEAAINLSHKSSRSPTPLHFRPYALGETEPPSSVVPFMFRQNRGDHSPPLAASPSNELTFPMGGKLKSILSQPAAVGGFFNSELLAVMNGGVNKRPWKQTFRHEMTPNWLQPMLDMGDAADDADDSASTCDDPARSSAKRRRLSTPLDTPLGAAQLKLGPAEEVEGSFSCDQCDKSFSKQSSLARHKYEHSGQRPHKCDVCHKAFKHKHHLTEHKRLHSGEKPFQCSKCLKRFSHSGSYSQHMNHRYSYCKPYRE